MKRGGSDHPCRQARVVFFLSARISSQIRSVTIVHNGWFGDCLRSRMTG